MKKLLSVLLCGVMLVSFATGCSPKKATVVEEQPTTVTEEVQSTDSTTQVVVESDEPAEPVVIEVFHYMTQETKRKGLDAVEAAFTAMYPNVSFRNTFYNHGTDYFPQLSTALVSGEKPEIIMGNPGLYPDLISSGYATDLSSNEIIKGLNLSEGDLGDVSANGKIYGFPIDFKTWGVFYNVKMFKELGIEIPKTQTELLAACQKIEDAGLNPWINAFGDAVYGDIEMRNTVWPRALAAGDKDLFENLMTGKKKFADYPYFKEALEVWQQRMQWSRLDAMSNNQNKALELFVAGEGAMFYTGSWGVGDLVAMVGDSDFEFNFFVAPIDDANSQKLNVQVDQAFMVNPSSENPEMAQKFLEYWITEGSLVWSETTLLPLTTGKSSDSLLPLVKTLAEIKESGDIAHYGSFTKPFSSEFTAAWRKILTVFAESCVTGGSITPDETLVELQKAFDDIIETSK